MDPARAFPVSWDQFHRDCRALAWRLSALGPFAAMVTVTRGGLVPAAIVARELSIRVIETVSISSYHGAAGANEATQGAAEVLKGLAPELAATGGTDILVVDDLVDTFITEVSQDTWIYFPWDLGLSFQSPISGRPG